MFYKYDATDKRYFIYLKSFVFLLVLEMAFLAITKSNIALPTFENKLSFGIGIIGVIFVVVLAYLNRLKSLFKIKSVGFVTIAFILFFLKQAIEAMSLSFILISIPLLIDDLIINNYFKYLNMTKYFESYKYIGAHHD